MAEEPDNRNKAHQTHKKLFMSPGALFCVIMDSRKFFVTTVQLQQIRLIA